MYNTICALATLPGGAIGVIRVSGKDAIVIVNRIFSKDILSMPANTLCYGNIIDMAGKVIDEVVVSIWHAPHSYTGENAVEISCHGSAYILKEVLHLLIEAGCYQALPGEFTQRAYLNGKMDLSQAEAVADLVASSNKASYKLALSQMKGHFSNELSSLRKRLLKITSLLELELDFSEHEDLEFADRTELISLTDEIDKKVLSLLHSFKIGQALKEGIAVAIIGKTNVGKSTLLNALLGEERAIVSNIEGTTRDVIEDVTEINGISFRFIDTAGIRQTIDEVEKLGIERTYKMLDKAQMVIWVIDDNPSRKEYEDIKKKVGERPFIIVRNKIDTIVNKEALPSFITLSVSAKEGTNIEELKQAIYKKANIPAFNENSVIVTNARHYDVLTKAHEALCRVHNAFKANLPGDLVAEDLKDVLSLLGEITGTQISSQETLNNIFKHFCIGK
jgi:tRNA modification GTPase trmE